MRAAIFLAVLCLPASGALADDKPAPACPLQEAISLDMTTRIDGSVSVPVKLNGKTFAMTVDTGSPYTSINLETAQELDLPLQLTSGGSFMNNIQTNEMANLKSLNIGNLDTSWPVLVTPNFITPWQAGLLGQDLMRGFDVEIDYYHSKLNLFVHNTCAADAAYWSNAVAVVPFEVNKSSHILVKALLDGKEVTVLLDTGSDLSSMSLENAQDIFDLRSDDPRLKVVRQERINGGASTPVRVFPFSTLSFAGVAVSSPLIELIPKQNFGMREADVILGSNVLRRLRMYIAYSQNKIYLTDAEASK
jgi:predicted aspartyl protease